MSGGIRQGRRPGNVTPNLLDWQIDQGAIQLLKRRAAANAEDDHFDALTLDAKWSVFNGLTYDLTSLPGWLKTSNGSSGTRGLIQAVPAGNWSIEGEFLYGHS